MSEFFSTFDNSNWKLSNSSLSSDYWLHSFISKIFLGGEGSSISLYGALADMLIRLNLFVSFCFIILLLRLLLISDSTLITFVLLFRIWFTNSICWLLSASLSSPIMFTLLTIFYSTNIISYCSSSFSINSLTCSLTILIRTKFSITSMKANSVNSL